MELVFSQNQGNFFSQFLVKTKETSNYKQSYTQERNLIKGIDSNDRKLLEKRTNLKQEQITNICIHHHDMLVVRYKGNHKSCCNPFLSHQKVCRASLRVITMHTVLEAETIDLNLIPGKKLCPTCQSKVMTCLSKSISENKNDEEFDIFNERSIQNKKESVDTHFASAGVSPIKVKGLYKSGKIREGKRKLTALTTSIKKKLAISLNISEESFAEKSSFNNEYMEKANLFDNMMVLLTNKIAESTSISKKSTTCDTCSNRLVNKKGIIACNKLCSSNCTQVNIRKRYFNHA
nr:ARL14 effector protein-like [Hydra vulgaris]